MNDFRKRFTIFLMATLTLPAMIAAAENWPHWRGPSENGIAEADGLPVEWSTTKNVRWRLELPGAAASTPIVWGDRIYLTTADGKDDLALMAVSKDGEVIFKKKITSGNYDARRGESNAASPSPSTDGKNVYVTLGTGDLVAYSMDGEENWRVKLQERYKKFNYYFGMSSTPLLDDGALYLLLLHTDAQVVVAIDTATGEERWRHVRDTDARAESLHSYASPVMYRGDGREVLLIHGADYITAHVPTTGKELWRRGGLNGAGDDYNPMFRLVATPAVSDRLIVTPSAKNGPVLGLAPDGTERWRLDRGTPDVPSPLIHKGIVYLSRENGILIALDAEAGEEIYLERVHSGRHRGSPIAADGKIFLVGMDGTVSVVQAGRDFKILGQNSLDEQLSASPVAVGDTLYLRTYEALYAIGQKAEEKAEKTGAEG